MLQKWLGHLEPERFFDSYWGKRDVIFSTWLPDSAKVPFELQDFQSLLNEGRLRFPQVQCFDGGTVASPSLYTWSTHSSMSDVVSAPMIGEMVRQHKTIRISNVQALHPPLKDFAASLAESFGCEVKINAYYCMGPAGGLAGHYDSHHIFAAQIAGQKLWNLGPIVIDSPDREFRPRPATPPSSAKKIIVKPGYVLYMPPGMWHDVYTDDVSLHLSIGIHPHTWSDCLEKLVQASRQRHPLLRAALPFSIVEGRCVYRMEVKDELQQLLDLVKKDIPESVQPYFTEAASDADILLPSPSECLPISDLPLYEEISGILDDIWDRASRPCSLYLRGNVPRSRAGAGTSWDLDIVLVVHEMDAVTQQNIASAHDDIRQRFTRAPSLDLFCCTCTELLAGEELLQVRIALLETGLLFRGDNLLPVSQCPPFDHDLADRLAKRMRRSLSNKISVVKNLDEGAGSSRLPSLCKSVLRIAAVPVIRDEARFIRDPVACFFEIARRFPDQLENAELLLNGLFARTAGREELIGAAESLIQRIL